MVNKMQDNAIKVALADRRRMREQRIMGMDRSYAFRLAALNAMGGERRLS